MHDFVAQWQLNTGTRLSSWQLYKKMIRLSKHLSVKCLNDGSFFILGTGG
jgi:hypothetical protein